MGRLNGLRRRPVEGVASVVEDVIATVAHRRADVVRRLLDHGLTPGALQALLPGWEAFVAVALDRCAASQ
jgi:hypothetical protein